ncbi:hypothetical protein GCM10010417_54380 [Streptomyces carpaticus]
MSDSSDATEALLLRAGISFPPPQGYLRSGEEKTTGCLCGPLDMHGAPRASIPAREDSPPASYMQRMRW